VTLHAQGRAPAAAPSRPPTESRAAPPVRLLDVTVAAVLLALLWPVLVVVAAAVRCTSRGPVLFRQERLGLHRRPFVMLKFRTMSAGCDDRLHREYIRALLAEPAAVVRTADGLYKLPDDPRVTAVGRWLRRTCLDELPQLVNVLRGDMALVGPRPCLPWEAALFDPRYDLRFDVRPGITGLWQTSGRNRLTMTEALDLDVQYVRTRSLLLDLTILRRTVPAVLRRADAR